MKTLIIVLLSWFSYDAYSQSATYTETKLFDATIINNTTTEGQGAFTNSTGFAIQGKIDCPGTCTVDTAVWVSIDGVDYQRIKDFDKQYLLSTVIVYNVYSQFYKYFKIQFIESSGNPATVSALYSTKGQL